MEYFKDKYILLPFVKQTDCLYTIYGITPNNITLINCFIFQPIIFFLLIKNNYLFSLIFLMIRALLDGSDGYIARKYELISKNGEIYDHVGDAVFIGLYSYIGLLKLNIHNMYLIPICNTIIMTILVINFSKKYTLLAKKICGIGGCYEAYSTMSYILAHTTIYCFSK